MILQIELPISDQIVLQQVALIEKTFHTKIKVHLRQVSQVVDVGHLAMLLNLV